MPCDLNADALRAAYAAGFANSSEGYNAEYPFDGDFEADPKWAERRDENVRRILDSLPPSEPRPEPAGVVTDEMVDKACEIARELLEIDWDGEDAFIREDSLDAAIRAVLSALTLTSGQSGEGWPDKEEGVDDIVQDYRAFINARPALLSLLYDIDMLPEQCVTRIGAVRLAGLCEVWKKGEEGSLPASPSGETRS